MPVARFHLRGSRSCGLQSGGCQEGAVQQAINIFQNVRRFKWSMRLKLTSLLTNAAFSFIAVAAIMASGNLILLFCRILTIFCNKSSLVESRLMVSTRLLNCANNLASESDSWGKDRNSNSTMTEIPIHFAPLSSYNNAAFPLRRPITAFVSRRNLPFIS